MIARRRFFHQFLGGFAASVFVPVLVKGAGKARGTRRQADASPPPTAEKPGEETPPKNAVARLRLWKIGDSPDRPLQIRLLPAGKPASAAITPLKVEEESYQFSSFVEVPAGMVTVEISSPERTTVRLPLLLTDESRSTLLVRLTGTSLSAEWIDDTPGPVDNGNKFCVYNFLPASGDIRVELGTLLSVHLTSAHGYVQMEGLKKPDYPIVINGPDGSGKNFHWDTEVDFHQSRKVTLLLCLDAYGRIQPKIVTA